MVSCRRMVVDAAWIGFADLRKGHLMTPPIESERVTTPPIPSSSPGYDAMDISPLPHKAPHFSAKVTLPSPSPEGTPMLSEEISAEDLHHEQRCMVADPVPAPPTFLQLPEYVASLSRVIGHGVNPLPDADGRSRDLHSLALKRCQPISSLNGQRRQKPPCLPFVSGMGLRMAYHARPPPAC